MINSWLNDSEEGHEYLVNALKSKEVRCDLFLSAIDLIISDAYDLESQRVSQLEASTEYAERMPCLISSVNEISIPCFLSMKNARLFESRRSSEWQVTFRRHLHHRHI